MLLPDKTRIMKKQRYMLHSTTLIITPLQPIHEHDVYFLQRAATDYFFIHHSCLVFSD
jgi:hypothetical protein